MNYENNYYFPLTPMSPIFYGEPRIVLEDVFKGLEGWADLELIISDDVRLGEGGNNVFFIVRSFKDKFEYRIDIEYVLINFFTLGRGEVLEKALAIPEVRHIYDLRRMRHRNMNFSMEENDRWFQQSIHKLPPEIIKYIFVQSLQYASVYPGDGRNWNYDNPLIEGYSLELGSMSVIRNFYEKFNPDGSRKWVIRYDKQYAQEYKQ